PPAPGGSRTRSRSRARHRALVTVEAMTLQDAEAERPDLARLTALQLRDALAVGQESAVAVTRHFLAVTARRNPELGAFLSVAPESALQRAGELDDRFAESGPTGALHGMPLAF